MACAAELSLRLAPDECLDSTLVSLFIASFCLRDLLFDLLMDGISDRISELSILPQLSISESFVFSGAFWLFSSSASASSISYGSCSKKPWNRGIVDLRLVTLKRSNSFGMKAEGSGMLP